MKCSALYRRVRSLLFGKPAVITKSTVSLGFRVMPDRIHIVARTPAARRAFARQRLKGIRYLWKEARQRTP